ncbi:MAG: gliding motility-associated C-terminal domain-containing protein [Bacteroidales bacterium]|nr:gliding motility-associated C-terminal domain-containing protein [Bacteroidales bacterium]
MQKVRLYILSFIVFLFWGKGISQIISPFADFADAAAYESTLMADSLYFFRADNDSAFIMADTSLIKADSLTWEVFLPGAGFQFLAKDTIKIAVSPSPTANGYKLTAWEGDSVYSSVCWAISYSFTCSIITKDENDTLLTGAYTAECDRYGPIRLKVESDPIIYFDPELLDTLVYNFKYKRTWHKEKEVPEGRPTDRGFIGSDHKYYIENAYWEDMWYWVVVSDSLGYEKTDSVFVRSIQPKAEFTFSYITLDDTSYYADKDSAYYFFYGKKSNYDAKSAPAYYFFENKSINAHEYLWDFGDSTTFRTSSDSVLKIYNNWSDNYTVNLKAIHIVKWSGKQCISEYKVTEGIEVSEPVLKAPNVFSVNSAELPAWRFYDVSVTDFEISIYSRNGRRVHHFKGNIRDWDGWDGYIGNSGDLASTGVYYYVVKKITSLKNFDPLIDNPAIWPQSAGGSTSSNTTGNNTNTGSNSNSGNNTKEEAKNNEYRGFFHLFNNE